MSFNELALFAGAGGGLLGGRLLGWHTVCAVEIDPWCRKVLLQRQRDGCLPEFPIWDDVRTFEGWPWRGAIDVISGGFPCQDISCAGTGKGITGERSGLWGEFARIIGEVGPRFVFVENSPLLVSRGLDRVLGDLAEMGYDARWGVLGACHAGAPHRRERIWIVAHHDGNRCDDGSQGQEILEGHMRCCSLIWPTMGGFIWARRCGRTPNVCGGGNPPSLLIPNGNHYVRKSGKKAHLGLDQAVRMWPTPTQSDGMGGPGTSPQRTGGENLRTSVGGSLNPTFVEYLMGWPYDYTSLKQGRLPLSREEITEECLRIVWCDEQLGHSPQGQEFKEQLAREYPNALQFLSHKDSLAKRQETVDEIQRLLRGLWEACHSWPLRDASESFETAWQSASREQKEWIALAALRGVFHSEWPGVPRVATNAKHRVDRLRCLGNGQVPAVAALAWKILMNDEGKLEAVSRQVTRKQILEELLCH